VNVAALITDAPTWSNKHAVVKVTVLFAAVLATTSASAPVPLPTTNVVPAASADGAAAVTKLVDPAVIAEALIVPAIAPLVKLEHADKETLTFCNSIGRFPGRIGIPVEGVGLTPT